MTETKPESQDMDNHSQNYVQSGKHPEIAVPFTRTANRQDRDMENRSSVFTEIIHLLTELCPWLSSTDEFKKSMRKAVASIKERPMTSILFGFIALFGFIPFAGFVLLICGSFALLFTWFVFCQFLAVLLSALVCTGVFWVMLSGFVVLAVLLGGAVHTFKLWGTLARHTSTMLENISKSILQRIWVYEQN